MVEGVHVSVVSDPLGVVGVEGVQADGVIVGQEVGQTVVPEHVLEGVLDSLI